MAAASIRTRLTAWYGLLLAVTIAGLGAAVYWLTARSLVGRVDAALEFELAEAAEQLRLGQTALELTAAPEAFHETYLFRVVRPDGRTEAQSPALGGEDFPAGPAGASTRFANVRLGAAGRCRVATREVGSGAGRRVVQIATPLAPIESDLAEIRNALWTILPAGVVVATAGGYWLAGRALAPVERMTEAARRVSGANLGERVGVDNPGDELGRLGVTLNAMLDRIDRAFAASRRFTADAAHELRTPLASIRTEADVALLAPRSAADYQETLRSIVEESERLARLADRLLLLSREDSGPALPRWPVRLDEAVRAAAEAAAEAAARAGVTLTVGPLPETEVEGDADLLRQVFDNLLDNAVKYTPAGGAVTVAGSADNGRAVVEVADTGVGIPADALPRVFDRFFRVDASRSRRTGGTGLGLSIVKAVVERHGGTAEATSSPGEGSTFRVRLPAADGANGSPLGPP